MKLQVKYRPTDGSKPKSIEVVIPEYIRKDDDAVFDAVGDALQEMGIVFKWYRIEKPELPRTCINGSGYPDHFCDENNKCQMCETKNN